MTAPAIHPEAIDAALPDFDADVACEYDTECDMPAVWRVRAHGFHRHADTCSTQNVTVCNPCLTRMRHYVESEIGSTEFRCRGCHKPLLQVSDVILSVVAL